MNNRKTGWIAPRDQYAIPVMFNPYTGKPRDVRALQWCLTWVSVPLQLASPTIEGESNV